MNDLDLCLKVVQEVTSTIAASIAPKLLELESSNLVHGFVWEYRAGAHIIFPENGRGPGHVSPCNFWHTIELHISKTN